MPDSPTQLAHDAIRSLNPALSITRIERLSTLPHSSVSRIILSNGETVIFKQAGTEKFAAGIQRELLVNRDILAVFSEKVAPELLSCRSDARLPWMIFEDIAVSHRPAPSGILPDFQYVEKLVRTLASSHTLSVRLDLMGLFSNIQGDVHITDGSENTAPLLDEFLHSSDLEGFPPPAADLIRKIRDNIPRIIDLISGPAVLVHGDAHFGNAMYADDALLLDWPLAVIGPGEVDLLLTVVVAAAMKRVPGIQDSVWAFLFNNAVQSAIDHDSQALLG